MDFLICATWIVFSCFYTQARKLHGKPPGCTLNTQRIRPDQLALSIDSQKKKKNRKMRFFTPPIVLKAWKDKIMSYRSLPYPFDKLYARWETEFDQITTERHFKAGLSLLKASPKGCLKVERDQWPVYDTHMLKVVWVGRLIFVRMSFYLKCSVWKQVVLMKHTLHTRDCPKNLVYMLWFVVWMCPRSRVLETWLPMSQNREVGPSDRTSWWRKVNTNVLGAGEISSVPFYQLPAFYLPIK